MRQAVVELNKIKVLHSGRVVLDIDRLAVQQGDLIAVVGPNGAGKSTLLKLINLLLAHQAGELSLFGHDVGKIKDVLLLRRRCSMVFQDSLLLTETVFDNVALPLRLRGVPEPEVNEKVEAVLIAFHCLHLTARMPQSLSGGEAQRVSLARAMVYGPELLLLDEPFASIDAPTRLKLLGDLKRVALERGITTMLVSHSFDDVLDFAERVVVLAGGRIIQEDCPEEIMRRPAQRVVAELTGMDNILACKVIKDGGAVIILANGKQFVDRRPAPADVSFCCLPGDALQLFADELAVPSGWTALSGVVQQVVPGIGVYRVTVDAQALLLTVRVPREQAVDKVQPGQTVHVAFQSVDTQLV